MAQELFFLVAGYVLIRCVDTWCASKERYSENGRAVAIGSTIVLAVAVLWLLAANAASSAPPGG